MYMYSSTSNYGSSEQHYVQTRFCCSSATITVVPLSWNLRYKDHSWYIMCAPMQMPQQVNKYTSIRNSKEKEQRDKLRTQRKVTSATQCKLCSSGVSKKQMTHHCLPWEERDRPSNDVTVPHVRKGIKTLLRSTLPAMMNAFLASWALKQAAKLVRKTHH